MEVKFALGYNRRGAMPTQIDAMRTDSESVTVQNTELAREALRTPRAAAVAGILFAILFTASIVLIRLAIPEDLTTGNPSEWAIERANIITLALTLAPFAGIAFLWFMGVVRSRLGKLEDQFLSTVFFGSGLLFLALLFVSASLAGGLITSYSLAPARMQESGMATFARAVMYNVSNVYAMRMAGVFMISSATIWIRTGVMPRLFAYLSYVLALLLLVSINFSLWLILVFPVWVLVISIVLLVRVRRGEIENTPTRPAMTSPDQPTSK